MRSPSVLGFAFSSAVFAVSGCAEAPSAPSGIPANLKPPAGHVVSLEALASGVQIYECAAKPAEPRTYEWAFRAPEATLTDRSGRLLGKHYAGPTWESTDGSLAVGEVKARDPGPDPKAIPWLLLGAKSTAGTGVLGATKYVLRANTAGGIAPAEACSAANLKQVARVPYTAAYYFYRAP